MFEVFPLLLRYVVMVIVVDAVAMIGVAFVGCALLNVSPLVHLLVRVIRREIVSLLNWLNRFLVVDRHARLNRMDRMDLWNCFPNQENLLRGLSRSPRDKANNNETLCQPEVNVAVFFVYTLIDIKFKCVN